MTTNTHIFNIHSQNDENVSISLNGEQIMSLNHDQHGWDGIEAATTLVTKIAAKIGAQLTHTEGYGELEEGMDEFGS